MADENTPLEPQPQATEQTWFQWPDTPVYGATEGAQPPDLERPWDFRPPATAYNQQPQQPPAATPPSPSPPAAHDQQTAAPPHPPPPAQPSAELPSPVGPAETPDDRARRLGLIPPANGQPRHDENQ